MTPYSKKIATVVMVILKLVMSVVILCCPELFGMCYPFALFTPVFLMAIAYGGISKVTALGMIILLIAISVAMIVLPVLLMIKKRRIGWITIVLQVLFIIEALSLVVSFFMGGFFRKLLGAIFNVIIAALLAEIRQAEKYST